MSMQIVELHFSTEPKCNYAAIQTRAEELLGEELYASAPCSAKDAFLLVHKSHPIQIKDGVIAPQTVLLRTEKPTSADNYADEIQQSWRFPDCAAVFAKSKCSMLVTEMMAQCLSPNDRVQLFHGVLQAVIELTQPIALVFKHSQQVISPQQYLESVENPPICRPGSLNVRLFNISNSSGEMLMDTRGLTEIGLHDLQCHFCDLDPGEVSRVLFNTAVYIFENGPVIESGNTVQGIQEGSKWRCQFETSLVGPERDVLDLNPGRPYAAGSRK